MAASDSRPIPKKGVAFRLRPYIEDENGNPVTGFTSPNSTISKDDAAFAACTNEATFVDNGYGYIDLTTTEMNCDGLVYRFECEEGSYQVEICPEEAGDIRVNATQIGGQTVSASGTVTFPNATLASTTNITGGTITTVTSVTNPVTLTSAYDPAKTAAQAATLASIGTKVDAIDASTFGIKGATFDTSTDSLEALRNRGDAAWGGGASAAEVAAEVAALAGQDPTSIPGPTASWMRKLDYLFNKFTKTRWGNKTQTNINNAAGTQIAKVEISRDRTTGTLTIDADEAP